MENNPHIPDIEYTAALLQYVRMNAEIRPFLKAADNDLLRLNQTIDALIMGGYIIKYDNTLELTKKGENFLLLLNKRLGRKGLYAYFLPDYSVKKKQLKKNDIYIPQYMYTGGDGHFSNSYIYLE